MALIQCHQCSKGISDKAPHCPHCGAPNICVVEGSEGPSNNSMKMLKKGFIALTLLGVVLFFGPIVTGMLGFDVEVGGLASDLLGLGFGAIGFGIGGTVIAISYEKWVEYRNREVKIAFSVGGLLSLLQIGFAGVTMLGVLTFVLHFTLGSFGLPPVFIFGVRGMEGVGTLLIGFFLFGIGAVGFSVVDFASRVAHRKRAGKEKSFNAPRSVVPVRRSVKDYALAMAPIGVFIIVALFPTGVIGRPPDGPYEEFHENGQLAYKTTIEDGERHGPFESYFENGQLSEKGTYNSELGDWRFGELDGLYESYFENGQLMNKSFYKDGRQFGLNEGYYDNGQLRFRTNYDSGEWMRVDGREEWYFPDGRLMSTGIYNMGERCGEWILDKDQSVSPSDVITDFGEEFLTLTYDRCPPRLEGEEGN